MESTTLLTYAEHEMDEEQLLNIEFEGFYDKIIDVGMMDKICKSLLYRHISLDNIAEI